MAKDDLPPEGIRFIRPRKSRFSLAFQNALEDAQLFMARGETPEQLTRKAIEKLRKGTNRAELVELTGWSVARVERFLAQIVFDRNDVIVAGNMDDDPYKKITDRN